MSKKCCGIIYKDEKFCTMCGKALKDVPDDQDILNMEEVEKIAAEVLGDKVAKSSGTTDEIKEEHKEALQEKTDEAAQEAQQDSVEEAVQEVSQDASQETNGVVEDTADAVTEEPAVKQPQDEKEDGDKADNQEEDEDDDEEEYDDGTASGGLKFFGTLMILLMLASVAIVGLGVYFIFLKPFYRDHDINNPVVYQQMATDTDVTNIETRPTLVEVSIDSLTEDDASQEDIATDSDATATDADASQDME